MLAPTEEAVTGDSKEQEHRPQVRAPTRARASPAGAGSYENKKITGEVRFGTGREAGLGHGFPAFISINCLSYRQSFNQ